MNCKTSKHNNQRGFIDFGAGIALIIAVAAVATLLGGATVIREGYPPASAPDGWYMMKE